MAVEVGLNPQNESTKTKDYNTSISVESIKRMYEKVRQEEGNRYFAYSLGVERAEADSHAQFEQVYAPFRQQAVAALLPQIMRNPELMEIYQTSYQLMAEEQRVFNERMNQGPLTEDEKKKKEAELDRRGKIRKSYEAQLLAASKPAVSPEQQPPLPRVCMHAVKYRIRNEMVPETHTHSCPICSAQSK